MIGNLTSSGHQVVQRLDKWLWFARIVKTRTRATQLVCGGKVRVNRAKIDKASHTIRAGDVVTVTVKRRICVLEVLTTGQRRGPAPEAQGLYRDLTPEEQAPPPLKGLADMNDSIGRTHAPRGSPNKKERRQIAKLRGKGR